MITVFRAAPERLPQRSAGAAWQRVAWRPAALVVSIVVAYYFSLSDLVRAMQYDTPLAYLGLVPPVAFVMGCYCYHRSGATPVPLRSLDAIAGGALLVLAGLIGLGLPVVLNAYAWSQRLDLLSLPLFAAGLVIVLYGTSALRWAWPALVYSLFIWPVPYGFLLDRLLTPLTNWTAWATARMVDVFPLSAAIDPTDASVFTIATPSGPQAVSIGSTCSGFNSFVAWIVIGIALCVVVRGRRGNERGVVIAGRFAVWIVGGTLLTLLGNVVRILVLFAVAHRSGLSGTFEWVHALLGVSLFAMIVLLMLLVLPLFGLVLRVAPDAPAVIAPVEPSAFPAQAAFLAFGVLVLAGGALISIGIFELMMALIGLFLLSLFFSHDFSDAKTGGPPDEHVPAPPMREAHVIGIVIFGALFATVLVLMSRYLTSHNDALQALGWQIGTWQQETLGSALRFFVAAALFGGAFAVAALIVRAPRYLPEADRPLQMRPLTGPVGAGVTAGLIVLMTGMLAVSNVTVASFGSGAAVTGVAAGDFDVLVPTVPDVQSTFVESYEWPKQFLGSTATYTRYMYDAPSTQPFWLDIVTTENPDALAYHQVHNCYAFHGYINKGEREISIGNGVTARIVNYVKPEVNETWSTLYWEQRIERNGTRFFQRVVMLYALSLAPDESVTGTRFTTNNALMQTRATQVLEGLIAPLNR